MTSQSAPPGGEDSTSGPTAAPVVGSQGPSFGPYQFLHKLGEGGMGEVWLAEQTRPVRRQVAIKVVKAGMDTAQVVSRFEAERQALAVMDHPAIAKIFDGGSTPEGRPYFAMEYVRGEPITRYCDRQRLTIAQRLELFMQLCDGVQHAHQKGIIHRDLKPSNVLVSTIDDQPIPRIIDFGIAKAITRSLSDRPLFTELGGFLGTPEYMSPEQAGLTPFDVDTRSDIYSLGVLLYEMLTGTLPFESAELRRAGMDEIRRIIREEEPLRPSTRSTSRDASSVAVAEQRRTNPVKLASLLRGDLDWITMKALDKERTRRYQTANALTLDIRRHLNDEPVSAGPPTMVYRMRKFVRRHRVGVAAAAALGLLVLAFTGVVVLQAQRIATERDRANQEAATAKQVSDFLVGLFSVSDPSEARGNSLTAREILDKGAQEIDLNLGAQPQTQARLQETMGSVYNRLGLYKTAEPLLQRALDTARRVMGADSPETLRTAAALAETYFRQGRYLEAETLFIDTAQRYRQVLGEQQPESLEAATNLAVTEMYLEKWDEAERILKQTEATAQRVFGEGHLTTLTALHNLGSLYWRQGRYAESLPFTTRAVDGRSRILGIEHPETLASMHNLATTYDRLGRFDEAEQMYLKTIAAKRRVLGDAHDSTNITRRRLASMYEKQHRYADAEGELLESERALSSSSSADLGSRKGTVTQLIALYEAWNKPREAIEWRGRLSVIGNAR